MTLRTLLLIVTTPTLSALAGCATPQTAPREDTAVSTSAQQGSLQAQGEHKGCSCALRPPQEGAAQAADGKGCGCPHCAQADASTSAEKGKSCRCSHPQEGSQSQARDSEG